MALFDAEKIFRNLVAAMGVTPEQISSLIVEVVTEVRTIRAEREGFKAATAKVVPDVLARLEQIETLLANLVLAAGVVTDHSIQPVKELNHVGNQNEPGHVNGG